MEFFQVVTVAQARKVLASHWPRLKRKSVVCELTQALGLELAEDIVAQENVPGFTRSTVDGFAVRSCDTFGASEGTPVPLRMIGEVPMGSRAEMVLNRGEAVAVSTGGMLPLGADAVVMLEHTETLPGGWLNVLKPVAPKENVMAEGEDVKKGETVLKAGCRLRPQDLGVLAALGHWKVKVWEPWRVGILATGNEIVPVEAQPGPGQVRDINSYTLWGLVKSCGAEAKLYGIVPDDLSYLSERLAQALEESQVVLLSGGSSVGTRDLTLRLLSHWGEEGLLFHGVSIRPGKPTLAALIQDRMVFGLPGHPVSAMVSFYLFVSPLLKYGRYQDPEEEPAVEATLARRLSSDAGREDYVRVRLARGEDGGLVAVPLPGKSGLISTMVQADGFIRIPLEKAGLEAGSRVKVRLFI
ncbi:molybdopterin molybdochelatase [Thermanaeromonas toyohensis ToBE]|uniref:Molybdopterin molybdenumtransferase n=1 Tax=Thermanaeromonas toyohensis ToBE TaxID=698762 RepID=A0A1W1W2X2_9FIRM|nr:gephyrin-like molybdotransferase Glp [Thermanaeromonas toyohensis]SMB99936.1 molybdopterin molybdochelatase [Thermanaeromonas toyohensis ToBE]